MNLVNQINTYSKNKVPFFFLISYDLKKWDIIPLNKMSDDVLFTINDKNTYKTKETLSYIKNDFNDYKIKFDKVIENIKNGNTYIFNLTSRTKINNSLCLKDIYSTCNAKYKLYYKNKFLSFSPETFIKISDNKIYTYPMKGTINASVSNAKEKILNDSKELAEHTMIVDLLRNDLSIVSSNIEVEEFRYIDKIKAGDNELLQVSSKISGTLDVNWKDNLGDIITKLLPAGSITGAPKKSTVGLIKEIEDYDRNYFTGIWGIFDGETLDSSVLIRFLENEDNQLYYKSGGGITIDSNCHAEYNEMNDKVYIP